MIDVHLYLILVKMFRCLCDMIFFMRFEHFKNKTSKILDSLELIYEDTWKTVIEIITESNFDITRDLAKVYAASLVKNLRMDHMNCQ